ncbi:MAG: DUF4179 domain-containing protein [Oscillospiraceae bacterium]|nr:DUF4179 domain-containing protein [Oscillospiraceae bacterium]
MTSFQLLKGLTEIDSELLVSVEQQTNASKTKWSKSQSKHLSGKKIWLIAAVIVLAMLLVGCAVAYAMIIFGSPAEMISALYGENTGFASAPPTEVNDPGKPGSAYTVPGYEKQPVEETVAQELEKWISPVGKSITTDGYKLTVDAYIYDSNTQCGLITMLLEHENPIPDEELFLQGNGQLGGYVVDINQYGYAYLIPEKTTPTQLAFTYYFRADVRTGTNLLVSFPDFEEQARLDEYERNRKEGVAAIRQRLKDELTAQEAAEKMRELGYGGGYTGDYDDYYYLAALEYDTAHADALTSKESMELQVLRDQLEKDLTPDEAVQKLRSLWGDALVEETFAGRMDELPAGAYHFLARRAYEQAHADEMVCVSLTDSGSLPFKTFGQGDVYVNSLCVRIRTSHYAESGSDNEKVIFHMTDGTDFVVLDDLTDNTLFKRAIENDDTLYMMSSAINIDNIQSVEVIGNMGGATLEADTE